MVTWGQAGNERQEDGGPGCALGYRCQSGFVRAAACCGRALLCGAIWIDKRDWRGVRANDFRRRLANGIKQLLYFALHLARAIDTECHQPW